MKRIFILHYSLEIGGAETSLLGFLQKLDYSKYEVYLMLLRKEGELLPFLPKQVILLDPPQVYSCLSMHIKDIAFTKHIGIACSRIIGKIIGKKYSDKTYNTKQYSHKLSLPFLPMIDGKYDLAISYIDPHYIIGKKVNAKIKLSWLHTDFSRIDCSLRQDSKMWDLSDYIVNVSDSCKEAFDCVHPELSGKSIVLENVLSKDYIDYQSQQIDTSSEMPDNSSIKLLSVGRFSEAKNFDNIPDICSRILKKGIEIKWYLIGYGGDEELIRQKIAEAGMEEHVIILGKKDNPYPYIKACDLYVQPSRYEGKCVAVREAQMLHKPVVITNYATSSSQLTDGYDGVIVPMDNAGCAEGLAAVIRDDALRERLTENTKQNDYSNAKEIEKLYRLIGNED